LCSAAFFRVLGGPLCGLRGVAQHECSKTFELRQAIDLLVQVARHEVRVGLEGHFRIAVVEDARDRVEVDAGREEQRRGGVPGVAPPVPLLPDLS
jgi:hypothetical protein